MYSLSEKYTLFQKFENLSLEEINEWKSEFYSLFKKLLLNCIIDKDKELILKIWKHIDILIWQSQTKNISCRIILISIFKIISYFINNKKWNVDISSFFNDYLLNISKSTINKYQSARNELLKLFFIYLHQDKNNISLEYRNISDTISVLWLNILNSYDQFFQSLKFKEEELDVIVNLVLNKKIHELSTQNWIDYLNIKKKLSIIIEQWYQKENIDISKKDHFNKIIDLSIFRLNEFEELRKKDYEIRKSEINYPNLKRWLMVDSFWIYEITNKNNLLNLYYLNPKIRWIESVDSKNLQYLFDLILNKLWRDIFINKDNDIQYFVIDNLKVLFEEFMYRLNKWLLNNDDFSNIDSELLLKVFSKELFWWEYNFKENKIWFIEKLYDIFKERFWERDKFKELILF